MDEESDAHANVAQANASPYASSSRTRFSAPAITPPSGEKHASRCTENSCTHLPQATPVACNPPLFAGAPCACPARKAPPAPVWVRLVPVTVRTGVSTRPRAQVGSLVCRPGSTFPPVLCALQKGHKPTAFCDLPGPFAAGAALSTRAQHQSHTSASRQVTVHTASLWLPSSAWP